MISTHPHWRDLLHETGETKRIKRESVVSYMWSANEQVLKTDQTGEAYQQAIEWLMANSPDAAAAWEFAKFAAKEIPSAAREVANTKYNTRHSEIMMAASKVHWDEEQQQKAKESEEREKQYQEEKAQRGFFRRLFR